MEALVITWGLAFLEGFGLIISPCILPILPIILSGSLQGSKKRPLGIIIGFVLTFAVFTLFSRMLIQATGIDLTLVRYISYGLLFFLGMIMLSSYLTEKFSLLTQRLANTGGSLRALNNVEGGFGSGIVFGMLVGIIWTPCAGPILAAVIVQTVLQQTTLASVLTVLFFGVGAAVPMLIIVLFGRKIMARFQFFKTHASLMRKLLGAIIIATVAYLVLNEGSLGATSNTNANVQQNQLLDGVLNPYPAPDFTNISAWINSPPLQMSQLRGKVVLIDFWTYSCINCVRTLPYLNDWYKKYHNQGLVIVGVHAPEFAFEHDLNNVKAAVLNDGVHYPVALDNQFGTWQAYQNRYWPAHYLINKQGYVVYQHFGEGEYATTENNIRYLLGLNATNATSQFGQEEPSLSQTPETYFGYARAARFMSPETMARDQVEQYTFPAELAADQWALQGAWTVTADKVTAEQAGAALKMHFNAGKVYVVMGNATSKPITVSVTLNGETLLHDNGNDVVNGRVTVKHYALYALVNFKQARDAILQLKTESPGLSVYTFTFGM